MSRQDAIVVERLLERWHAADIKGWLRLWHTDGHWIAEPFPGIRTGVRHYRGHADLLRLAVELQAGLAGLSRLERPRLLQLDASVLVLGDYKPGAAADGQPGRPTAWLFEVRDGKILCGRGPLDPAEFREARRPRD